MMDAQSKSFHRYSPSPEHVVGQKPHIFNVQAKSVSGDAMHLDDSTVKWWAERAKHPLGSSSNVPVNETLGVDSLLKKINRGDLLVVNSRRRNGLIIFREFYAEFAGPGAAVGGDFDRGCHKIIPLGNLSLIEPQDHEDHQKALKIRLQWIRLTQNFTDQPRSVDRAQMILDQFKTYFDKSTIDNVPNEAFALMVGVLPQTVRRVRLGLGA
ncbi:hypothetical protein [Leptothoe kymatousa]|nr:hypothetical protein [Leptothoe kymatousa]